MKELQVEQTNVEQESDLSQRGGEVDLYIQASIDVLDSLREIVTSNNKDKNSKTTITKIRKVFKAACRRYLKNEDLTISEFAFGRVNMYLRYISGDKVYMHNSPTIEKKKITALSFEEPTEKVSLSNYLDISDEWIPSEGDISLAKEYISKYNVIDFKNYDNLYFAEKDAKLEWD